MIKAVQNRMRSLLNQTFIRSSFTYFIGSGLSGLLPLLLLPILTRYLTPTDYGIVATSLVLVQMLTLFVGFNTSGLVIRSYFDRDPDSHCRIISTNIILAGILTIVLTILLIALREPIGEVTKFPSLWVPVTVVIAFFAVIQSIYLVILQSRDESKRYVFIQVLLSGLNLGLAAILVVGVGMDWQGRILATLIAGLIITAICFYGLIVRLGLLRMVFDKGSLRALLAFGIPLVPHFIGGWVMTMAPRLYLNNMATVADTGLFSVGYNVAAVIALVVGAANQAYVPELFKRLSDASTDLVRLGRILLTGSVVLLILSGAYGLVAHLFIPLIVGPAFYGASDYVLWLGLAFAMQGVYFIYVSFVVYSKKTSLMSWRADFMGGCAILVLCPLLIDLNGPIGAAQATFAAFTISTIGGITASREAFPMPWKEAIFSLLGLLRK